MKMTTSFKLVAIAAAVIALAACESDEDSDDSDETLVLSTCPSSDYVTINAEYQLNGTDVCSLKGYMPYGELTLDATKLWALDGSVYIGDDQAGESSELRPYDGLPTGYSDAVGAAEDSNHENRDTKLVIPAGTTLFGFDGPDALIVQRDAQIYVNGSASSPVEMTSYKDVVGTATEDDRGEWGGLVINGNANNNKGSDIVGEGFTGEYGILGDATYDNEDSGTLNYLVVKYAGYQFTPENELNGVAFQAVGRGTEVDYLQVHNNSDDGVEFFGGTVNVSHVVLTGNDDDSMDWTYGWTGNAQYVYIEQTGTSGDKGIEADSHKAALTGSQPQSDPFIANLTIVAVDGNKGMETRVATNATFYNAIITTTGDCIDFDNADDVNVYNSVLSCGKNVDFTDHDNTVGYGSVASTDLSSAGESAVLDSTTTDTSATITVPTSGAVVAVSSSVSANTDLATVTTTSGVALADADFIGAVNPDGSNDWTAGWTHPWK